MSKIVYARVKCLGSEVYYAGSSLNAIRQDLTDWDEPSTLVQITEEEAKKSRYFAEGREMVSKGECEVFVLGHKN